MTAPYNLPEVSTSAPAPKRGGPQAIASLFGDSDPSRAALVEAGLTLASHRGPGALLASFGAGKQAFAEAQQRAREEQAMQVRQQVQDILLQSGEDPESLLSTARLALAHGDLEGAKAILDIAKAQAAMATQRRTQVVGDARSGYKLIDLDTGALIADITGPTGTDPETFDQTMKMQTEYRQTIGAQGFDTDPLFIKQLRDLTPLALQENSEAQEGFLRALFRLQSPDLRRVSDDAVFAQADQKGLVNGKLRDDITRLSKGYLPKDVISAWLPSANAIIRGRMSLFDEQRARFSVQAEEFGLNPRTVAFDYFRTVRNTVPGVDPSTVNDFEEALDKARQTLRRNK